MLDRIGQVAYQLKLPADADSHNVFHVSALKLCPNLAASSATPLPTVLALFDDKGEPESILERKMVKRGRVATTKVLVKWKNLPEELATWEFYYDLLKKFPSFHP